MDNSTRLFSKSSIVLFSSLGSTFFASLLYAQNLRETKNGKFIVPTMIFSLAYSFFAYKLTVFINIPFFYSFLPLHLIGGLILVGPFWKYHIGIRDNYEKRKIWLPLIVFLVPISLFFFVEFYYSDKKMSDKEFEETVQNEAKKQMKNQLYVLNDSATTFFDIEVPLLSSSHTFRTTVEDVNSIYDFKDYAEGRFSIICTRTPLADNEVFGIDLLRKTFPELISTNCNNKHFDNIICADVSRTANDTTIIHGSISLIKIDRMIYQFITQFVELDKPSADSLSYYLIGKINPASSK